MVVSAFIIIFAATKVYRTMATQIKHCNCTSEFQDATYGKGMRLFNEAGKDKAIELHCTVCGNTIKLNESKK